MIIVFTPCFHCPWKKNKKTKKKLLKVWINRFVLTGNYTRHALTVKLHLWNPWIWKQMLLKMIFHGFFTYLFYTHAQYEKQLNTWQSSASKTFELYRYRHILGIWPVWDPRPQNLEILKASYILLEVTELVTSPASGMDTTEMKQTNKQTTRKTKGHWSTESQTSLLFIYLFFWLVQSENLYVMFVI